MAMMTRMATQHTSSTVIQPTETIMMEYLKYIITAPASTVVSRLIVDCPH